MTGERRAVLDPEAVATLHRRQIKQHRETAAALVERADRGSVMRYYQPGRGYSSLDAAGQEGRAFAVSLVTADGELHHAGDQELPFALQSISKVLAYALALEDHGRDEVLRRVGRAQR